MLILVSLFLSTLTNNHMHSSPIYYTLKRGEPSNFDYAIRVNPLDPPAQRLLCSGRLVTRVELVFPIKNNSVPSAIVMDAQRSKSESLEFDVDTSDPSRTFFYCDAPILLNGKFMEFNISRDCIIIFHIHKD